MPASCSGSGPDSTEPDRCVLAVDALDADVLSDDLFYDMVAPSRTRERLVAALGALDRLRSGWAPELDAPLAELRTSFEGVRDALEAYGYDSVVMFTRATDEELAAFDRLGSVELTAARSTIADSIASDCDVEVAEPTAALSPIDAEREVQTPRDPSQVDLGSLDPYELADVLALTLDEAAVAPLLEATGARSIAELYIGVAEGEIEIDPELLTEVEGTLRRDGPGDDPVLDSLWDGCSGGSLAACDHLWLRSPAGSEYEAFAARCGDRVSHTDFAFACAAPDNAASLR